MTFNTFVSVVVAANDYCSGCGGSHGAGGGCSGGEHNKANKKG
jgi:hypothetical protein